MSKIKIALNKLKWSLEKDVKIPWDEHDFRADVLRQYWLDEVS